MRRKSNKSQVKMLARKAFQKTAEAFDDKNKEIITQPRMWEGFEGSTTRRSNGEIVHGAFRNIQDMGNLLNSQKLTVQGNVAALSWNGNGETPVQNVYFGFRGKNYWIPGRPWTEVARAEMDLSATFAMYFNIQ